MIFFDTSIEEEDININQKLIELIGRIDNTDFQCQFCVSVSEGSKTRLPKTGGEEIKVTLSFIMSTGDIYVRKEGESKNRNDEISEGDLAIFKEENSSERKVHTTHFRKFSSIFIKS